MKEKTVEFPSYSTEYLDDKIGGDDHDLDPLISDISVQQASDAESELDKHSPPEEITLEIRMIQGELGLISKEQVLHSIFLIILFLKLVT